MKRIGLVSLLLVCGCVSADAPITTLPERVVDPDDLTLEYEISEADQGGTFGRVGAVALSAQGELFVVDAMANEIRRFDLRGTLLNTIGRRGEGPGELEAVTAVGLNGDSVRVWDGSLWRIATFALGGAIGSTSTVSVRPDNGWPPRIAMLPDGTWLYLDQEIERQHDVEVEEGIIRGRARLMRWQPAQARWTQVAEFPGMEAGLLIDGGEASLTAAPFPAGPLWAAASDTTFWYADTRHYRAVRLDMSGDTIAAVTADVEGPPVTDADWDAFVGGRAADFTTAAAQVRRGFPRPARKPVLSGLLVSGTGEVWLQMSGSADVPGEWHVYGSDGSPQFRVRLPAGVTLRATRSDHMAVVVRDSLDVQRIQLLRLLH